MAEQAEIERTFLAKYLPGTLVSATYEEIIDLYVPFSNPHPKLRIRKQGKKYELTKKVVVQETDASVQNEITVDLAAEEYDELATVNGKRIMKRRYFFPVQNHIAQVDIFLDKLAGLVVVDFEFKTTQERDAFVPPDFCFAEVTHEEFIAGGVLAGKTFQDIKPELDRFGYTSLSMPV